MLCNNLQAQTITHISGSGSSGYGGDGSAATSSAVVYNFITGLGTDTSGNIYIADRDNYRIRKINSATGVVTTIGGTGTAGYTGDGGPATAARIDTVAAFCTDRAGNCYFAGWRGTRVRKIDHVTGYISTIAGNGSATESGDGGAATSAGIYCTAILVDYSGNIYLGGNTLRKIDASTGIIQTLAGSRSATALGDGGPATAASIGGIYSIAKDGTGNLYLSDNRNHSIRKVDTAGIITTIAGQGRLSGGTGCLASDTRLDEGYSFPYTLMSNEGSELYVGLPGYWNCSGTYKIDLSSHYMYRLSSSWGANCIDSRGSFYSAYNNSSISKITGAFSIFRSLTVKDSLVTSACAAPQQRNYIVYARIDSVPLSTDSAHITINFGNGTAVSPNVTRNYTLPYWHDSVSYGFGSATSFLDSFTYSQPGIFTPTVTLRTVRSYTLSEIIYADTVRLSCSGMMSGAPAITWVVDSLVSAACAVPAAVRFGLSGLTSDPTNAYDSQYVYVRFGDSALQAYTAPYDSTILSFDLAFTHNYLPGYYFPDYYTSTASGLSSSGYFPELYIPNCDTSSRMAVYMKHSSSNCSVPDTVTYYCFGTVPDFGATDYTCTMNIHFGDGTATSFSPAFTMGSFAALPAGSAGFFSGTFTHVFTTPGVYSSAFSDTIYDDAGTALLGEHNLVNYGTSPSRLHISTTCMPLAGSFYVDSNGNCAQDAGEVKLAYWPFSVVNTTTGDTSYHWCDSAGNYSVSMVPGDSYTVISNPASSYSFYSTSGSTLAPACPSTGIYSVTAGSTAIAHDFAFTCTTPSNLDMSVHGWANSIIPGRGGEIDIWSSNAWGFVCLHVSSDITLVLDTLLTYSGMIAGPAPTSISGDTLTWHFTESRGSFDFFGRVGVTTATTATGTDTAHFYLYVSPTSITDSNLANNTYTWTEGVRTSYDPNE
ncbi:MAG: hypothetical protein EBZ77_08935, partial [Chitinophagia bacterium]|nr:hypothetical protein [Chitinophagia bacterium]